MLKPETITVPLTSIIANASSIPRAIRIRSLEKATRRSSQFPNHFALTVDWLPYLDSYFRQLPKNLREAYDAHQSANPDDWYSHGRTRKQLGDLADEIIGIIHGDSGSTPESVLGGLDDQGFAGHEYQDGQKEE